MNDWMRTLMRAVRLLCSPLALSGRGRGRMMHLLMRPTAGSCSSSALGQTRELERIFVVTLSIANWRVLYIRRAMRSSIPRQAIPFPNSTSS